MPTPHLPDLDALRLLVGIARHGSIGATARTNGISQQAASERVRAMEAQTGLTLVRRGARGSQLTEAGVVVTEWAARLLDLADEVDIAIEGLRGDVSRELVVWASMTIAESLIPRWLVQLRQRQLGEGYLATTVSLNASNSRDVVEAVREGTAHVGFVEGVEAPVGVRSVTVAQDELFLVTAAGTPLSRRRTPLTPDEVAQLALTSREEGSGTREVLEIALAKHGLEVGDPEVELTTATAIREAVLAGSAPAFLSRRVVARDVDSGNLNVVAVMELDLRRYFRAIWVGTKNPPAGSVRDLVAIARATER
ncbi:LysR family transcriptional regulator [Nocardioides aurantiacus]|uniref:Molybdate transport repressor ModE-like protein n=1 Tax=Nocardioides aurantiacus TaxID=86796 RepID=A0A3N2CWD6_9ACTN|nr:LysR family transcriptional regulator [Nocardioides aurantiacus]ROR91857.1 molybdate transport repressor ModE-like protein [Nocardioides aurantiacus]